MKSLGKQRHRDTVRSAPKSTEVDLAHVRVLRDDDFINCRVLQHLRRDGRQRRNRHYRKAGTMRQPLRDGRSDAHADERPRTVAQYDGVEVWQMHAAFCEYLPDHWRQQARVLSCLLLVALNYDVANPQCHRACKRGRVYREQIHATAPLRSCAARKDETSVSDAVDGIGASAWRNLLP